MPNHYPITLLWNMQVHASEYGIHWNFFFTLAAVSLLAVIIHPSFTQAACLGPLILVGIGQTIRTRGASADNSFTCTGYQMLLSKYGLTEYIQTAPRVTLLSANK